MPESNVSQGTASGLPPELATAQEAINLPEVQEMLRRLSAYNLGIYMPHIHDEETGQFQPLPDEVVQVEKGLQVSFQTRAEMEDPDRYVQIGWVWSQGAVTPSASCKMVCFKKEGDTMHYSTHKSVD
jgi:hypothetical protein